MRGVLLKLVALARSRPALVISAIGVAAFFVMQTTRTLRRGRTSPLDAEIVFQKSLDVFQSGFYPAQLDLGNFHDVFPYPPPAIVIFAALAKLGPTAFFLLWLSLMAAGMIAAFRFAVINEAASIQQAFVALTLPVIAIVSNPVIYDLSNLNNNFILLGLTMAAFALAARRPVLSGALLALPITMKLYVGALLIWFVAYRPRAAVACLICLFALWGPLPALIFGVQPVTQLYLGWFDQIAIINAPWVYSLTSDTGGPPLITLRRAAALLTGTDAFTAQSVAALRTLQTGCVMLLAVYFARAYRIGNVGIRSRAALADWAVLLLAPLPFSPWFEPYHAVPMVIAVLLCLIMLFDDDTASADRVTAAGALGLVIAVQGIPSPFAARGLIYLVQFAALTIALAVMRPALAQAADQVAVTGGCDSTE